MEDTEYSNETLGSDDVAEFPSIGATSDSLLKDTSLCN
jgi:hypothetical protein